MVAATAQYGEAMGKRANKLWAPIRLVFAIGLLVPIAGGTPSSSSTDCGVVGLNTGQYIVLQVAKWGSGLASNVWDQFVSQLNPSSVQNPSGVSHTGSPSNIEGLQAIGTAQKMVGNYACAMAYNMQIKQLESYPSPYKLIREDNTSIDEGEHDFSPVSAPDYKKMCGGYHVPKVKSNDPYRTVYLAQRNVFGNYLRKFHDKAKEYVTCFVNAPTEMLIAYGSCPGDATNFEASVRQLDEEFNEALLSSTKSAANSADPAAIGAAQKGAAQGGWMTAGVWFMNISRVMGMRADSIRLGLPKVYSRAIGAGDGQGSDDLRGPTDATAAAMKQFEKQMNITPTNVSGSSDGVLGVKSVDNQKIARLLNGDADMSSLKDLWGGLKSNGLMELFYRLVYACMSFAGSLANDNADNSSYLAVKFDPTKNVFAELSAFGHNMVSTANWLFTGGILLQGFSGMVKAAAEGSRLFKLTGASVFGVGLAEIIAAVGAGLFAVGGLLIVPGALLAFILPLYPFLRFFFGTLTWLVAIAEAVVSAPLWALAHVNPQGDGLPGDKAIKGYYIILSILLRPVLMVLGLIVAYIIFVLAVSFLSVMFVAATKATGSVDAGGTLAKIIYSVLYCMIVFACGNLSFKTVGIFPQQALNWLGGPVPHHESIGDKSVSDVLRNSAVAGIVGGTFGGKILGSPFELRAQTDKRFLDAANLDKQTKARAADVQWQKDILAAVQGGPAFGEEEKSGDHDRDEGAQNPPDRSEEEREANELLYRDSNSIHQMHNPPDKDLTEEEKKRQEEEYDDGNLLKRHMKEDGNSFKSGEHRAGIKDIERAHSGASQRNIPPPPKGK